jgi:hypothetical protein
MAEQDSSPHEQTMPHPESPAVDPVSYFAPALLLAGAAIPPALFITMAVWNALHPLPLGKAVCGMPALGAMCATPFASIALAAYGYAIGKGMDLKRQ